MKNILIACLSIFLSVASVVAQSNIDLVARRAMQVGRVMQQERVYLHFDNTAYYLGENMWFKAYVSFGADNRPSVLSKVLYVELVAPEGYVVETKKYKLDDNGCCHGDFELKPLLLSGYYEVRAYTRYMLNWDKDAIFSRVFPVFDKVNADNWDFKNMLDRRRGFLQNGKWVSNELPKATLEFFPEGGHLVAGLQSRVAFELRENDGLFSEEKITILKNGEKLLDAYPVHMGKGSFVITPEAGASYTAETVIKNNNGKEKKYSFALPVVSDEGAVMHVAQNSDSVEVVIENNFKANRPLGFVVLHRGTMGFYKKLVGNSYERFALPKDQLPEGVNRVVLFVDAGTPLAERQFFIMHDTLQSHGQETVKLRLLANGYHLQNLTPEPNEKITLRVVRDDGKPISKSTNLSLSVADAQGNQVTSYSHNIYTYMLLGSEIKGYIPDASQYFNLSNENRNEHLDLIMLTHGWTSYDWNMLARKEITEMQPIERGITIKGRFFQKRLDQRFGHYGDVVLTPQPYNLIRLDYSSDSSNVKMITFRTDSTGQFILELDDYYGTRIASLNPQTIFKHSKNISYQFALDRYYSPGFRLYDYWERHLGQSMSRAEADSLVKLNPFEYMLSSVEVVAKKNKEINGRPPHSEMRFNYLDEWEYAQDVTYLDKLDSYHDPIYDMVKNEVIKNETSSISSVDSIHYAENHISPMRSKSRSSTEVNGQKYSGAEYSSDIVSLYPKETIAGKYIGHIRYAGNAETIHGNMPVDADYDHVLTAEDVVRSAIKRHGYNWAYWVQLMVVDGEYSSFEVPKPDMLYLHGVADAEKMTNFKEFVIRCDEKTRSQFENRDNYWRPLTFMLDNKVPLRKFYMGFLSQSYVYPSAEITDCPDVYSFEASLRGHNVGISYPLNPNYVACMIPYTSEERENGVVPEYATTGSSMRYTSVQGYSESKQFYSPDYSKMTPQVGDYRRTLLWLPKVDINDNGEAVVELYNNSVCDAIIATVEGRDGKALFSSSDIMNTRVSDKPQPLQEVKAIEKPKSLVVDTPMDPVLKAQCDAQFEKGIIYYNQKRYKSAIMIFAELVQYNYAPALYYVGHCYRDGTGVAKNDKLSMEFLQNAAKHNEPRAQYELAMAMLSEKTNKNDSVAALKWLELSAGNDEPRALFELSCRHYQGDGVVLDSLRAASLLEKAADLKHPDAMYCHGMNLVADSLDGIDYIRRAATADHKEALLYMLNHEHNAQHFNVAYKYAKRLHLLKCHEGTIRMAEYYYEGKGVRRDKRLAKDLYRDAAVAGNKEAKEKLRNL